MIPYNNINELCENYISQNNFGITFMPFPNNVQLKQAYNNINDNNINYSIILVKEYYMIIMYKKNDTYYIITHSKVQNYPVYIYNKSSM